MFLMNLPSSLEFQILLVHLLDQFSAWGRTQLAGSVIWECVDALINVLQLVRANVVSPPKLSPIIQLRRLIGANQVQGFWCSHRTCQFRIAAKT